jgi:hypothetical protein
MMQEGFGNAFYGRLGAIADVQTAGTISGMTAASPIVVNQTAHQMVSGDVVAITAAAGMPGAIGQWYVDVVDANHYSLYSDPAFTVPSNGTSQAYTGGAVADYSMLITRNLKPNTVERTTLDLCYNAAVVVWRWDNRFGVQPGSQGASCEINISAPLTAGSRIYSLVLEGKDAMPHADQ